MLKKQGEAVENWEFIANKCTGIRNCKQKGQPSNVLKIIPSDITSNHDHGPREKRSEGCQGRDKSIIRATSWLL